MPAKQPKPAPQLPALQLAFATVVIAVGYLYTATDACVRGGIDCFDTNAILTLPAPFRYRIISALLERLLESNFAPYTALLLDMAIHTLLIAILLPALFLWLRRWMSQDRAMLGIFALAMCFTVAFHFYMPFGSSIIEFALLGVFLVNLEGPFAVCVVLLILDSFNRETALMFVAIYGVWYGWAGKYRTLSLFVIWAVITAGLHIALGSAPHIYGFDGTLSRNLGALSRVLIYNSAFLPLWIMTVRKYRGSPTRLKYLVWIALIYGIAIIGGAAWDEVRLQLPILPLVMPIMLREDSQEAAVVDAPVSLAKEAVTQPQSALLRHSPSD